MSVNIIVSNTILENTLKYYIDSLNVSENIQIIEDALITEETTLSKNSIIITKDIDITDNTKYKDANIIYIPFNIYTLLNKIEEIAQNKNEVYTYNNIQIEIMPDKGLLKENNIIVDCTLIEIIILKHLFINQDTELSKEDLYNKVWNNKIIDTKLLDTHIYNIRQKLQINNVNLQIDKQPKGFILSPILKSNQTI